MRNAATMVFLVLLLVAGMPGPSIANHWVDTPLGAPAHWADNDPSKPRGYVYWIDYTGAEWPVYSAAIEWDKASRLDAIYVSTEAACPSHCVSVKEAQIGSTACGPQLGFTHLDGNLATGHLDTDTYVLVDTACSGATYDKRRTITCHEMGHSIGMGEQNVGTTSCMRNPYQGPWTTPSQHDYDDIAAHYNHND